MQESQPKPEKSKVALREEETLAFWTKEKVFEQTLEQTKGGEEFTFYDGPPFANGLPHYGHILASLIKDAIPRYKTMRGFHVARRWGWDCHGLPVENEVEKKLGLKTKKDIEQYGLAKFSEEAGKTVLEYTSDWKRIIPRVGRFVDMENDYRTLDTSYTESVWWSFKTLYDKGLIYEGFKSMHLCPRCETTLSNFEVSQGYKDTTDLSVTARFKILDSRFKNTYLLAWTTTPWTLPGNVALAINERIVYSRFKILDSRFKDEEFIVLKERLDSVLKDYKYEVIEEMKGSELIGLEYEPLFDYYSKDQKLENRGNGWKVYPADFVTTEDGTGIVHIAPAFGDDDYQLSQKFNLPFVQHVGTTGVFKPEVTDAELLGLSVKPKEDPTKTDIEIIKFLAHNGKLFSKEKFTHSYPFCWRCDSPLINYATSSWFVKVTDLKDKLVAENQKIKWVPEDIKDGRFGKWLEGARDWAISRSRFWGAPLPVWRCDKCAQIKVFGSVEDILKTQEPRNRYFVVRHGHAEHIVKNVLSSKISDGHHLTEQGRAEAKASAENLLGKKIDMIITSPLPRTQETAEIIRAELNIPKERLFMNNRLREVDFGDLDMKQGEEYSKFMRNSYEYGFHHRMPNGENLNDVKRRVGELLYEIDQGYEGKTILFVTHETPTWLLISTALGLNEKETIKSRSTDEDFVKTAEIRSLKFVALPHNLNYELDLHRPYIDSVKFDCKCGGEFERIPEVFDCWYESGAMPFASAHYPFEKKVFDPGGFLKKEHGFPASFIAEGLDQTRGWFYSMLVLGVGLFGKTPYRNVIVNGTVLAEDGQKMSKRLRNYPDPMEVVDKYGVDALRYYLLSSPAVKAQDLRFSEKGVDDVLKKVFNRLDNVLQFYLLYSSSLVTTHYPLQTSPNVLDQWILARLAETVDTMTKSFEDYELDKAVRPIGDFVEDISTWYLRRSRDRFKGVNESDKKMALETTRFVLIEFSKLIAPVAPFFAEYLYRALDTNTRMQLGTPTNRVHEYTDTNATNTESVHLEKWPETINYKLPTTNLLGDMEEVRRVVSLGLEARAKANIKVRQPLSELIFDIHGSNIKDKPEMLALVADEVNVKIVVWGEVGNGEVVLNTEITKELKEEGNIRELIRAIQDLRKNKNLEPKAMAELKIVTDEVGQKFLQKYEKEITVATSVRLVTNPDVANATEVKLGDLNFKLDI